MKEYILQKRVRPSKKRLKRLILDIVSRVF